MLASAPKGSNPPTRGGKFLLIHYIRDRDALFETSALIIDIGEDQHLDRKWRILAVGKAAIL